MKKMNCMQLGGACDFEFQGETFDEIAKQSKQHGMAMFQQGDQSHIDAMNQMQKMMQTPSDFANWYKNKMDEFERLDHL